MNVSLSGLAALGEAVLWAPQLRAAPVPADSTDLAVQQQQQQQQVVQQPSAAGAVPTLLRLASMRGTLTASLTRSLSVGGRPASAALLSSRDLQQQEPESQVVATLTEEGAGAVTVLAELDTVQHLLASAAGGETDRPAQEDEEAGEETIWTLPDGRERRVVVGADGRARLADKRELELLRQAYGRRADQAANRACESAGLEGGSASGAAPRRSSARRGSVSVRQQELLQATEGEAQQAAEKERRRSFLSLPLSISLARGQHAPRPIASTLTARPSLPPC